MARKIKAEIFSRVSGYFRPVSNWNRGKQEEFSERNNLIFNSKTVPVPEAELTGTGSAVG